MFARMQEKETLHTSGRHVNWCSHYGKQYGGSSKNYDTVIPILSIYPKKSKTLIQKNTCTPTFITALVTVAGRCGEIRTLIPCCWVYRILQPLQKTIWQSFKKLNIELAHDSAILLVGIYS